MTAFLSVLGSLLLIVISVCAYILKSVQESSHRIELVLTRYMTEHDALSIIVKDNSQEIKDVRLKLYGLEKQFTEHLINH